MQGDQLGSGYKLLNDGHIGLLALYLGKNEGSSSFTEYSEGLTELRQIVNDAKTRHPEAWIGLTGLPVLENDEMESSQAAMAQAGVLSFLGVGLLYIAGFGCVRHPVMALVALLVPMGWSFGYILLTVGHLNILSSAFATIVIGLGSDYGVLPHRPVLALSRRKDVDLRRLTGDDAEYRTRPDYQRRGHGGSILLDRAERFPGHRRVGDHRWRRHPPLLGGGPHHPAGLDPLV